MKFSEIYGILRNFKFYLCAVYRKAIKFRTAHCKILACASYDLTYVPQNFNAREIIKFAPKFKLNQFKEPKRLFKF